VLYIDYYDLLSEHLSAVKKSREDLLVAGVEVNTGKTKYTLMSHEQKA
jgi:hypothetical protein